jgi:hypothetical protein
MNPCHDNRNFIQLIAESQPDPMLPTGSNHTATLDNRTGQDLYDAQVTIGIPAPAGSLIALNSPGCAAWSHRWGCVPGQSTSVAQATVVRVNAPAAITREDITTTVTWTLNASQPLTNGHPTKVFTRHCPCTLTIT